MAEPLNPNRVTLLRSLRGTPGQANDAAEAPPELGAGDAATRDVQRADSGERQRRRGGEPTGLAPDGAEDRRNRREQRARRSDDGAKKANQPPIVVQLPPLPRRTKTRSWGTTLSFLACVVVPVALVSVYYFLIASPQFAVEFKFAVRQSQSSSSTPGAQMPGLATMLGLTTPDTTDNYIVTDFITSRQAVDELQKRLDIRKMYGRSDVDWLARFDEDLPVERFMPYWQRMVTANYDQVTGIATAQVRAFTAADADKIAKTIVAISEDLVNEIAQRPLLDAVRFAQGDVDRGEARLKAVRAALTDFRNSEQQIDPQAGIVTTNVLLAQALRTNITQMETELSTLTKEKVSPNSPVVALTKTRIKASREQLAEVEAQIRKSQSGSNPLSQVVGRFEQLTLEQQFAQALLQTAITNLELARSNAMAQRIYVSTFVQPAMPQSATYPKKVVSVLTTAFICLLFWTMGLLIVRSVREHIT